MKARTYAAPAAEEISTDTSTVSDMSTPVEDNGADIPTDTDLPLLDRNLYKSIKKMDRATLEGLIQDIYENGRKKGLKEAQELINTSENLVQQAEVLVAKGQKTVDEVT